MNSNRSVFQLENENGLRVQLLGFGARIDRIFAPDRAGQFADVVLGYDSPTEYRSDDSSRGAVCGRVANRIAGGRFRLEGKDYELACNNGPHHLHGGPRGWGHRDWQGVQLNGATDGGSPDAAVRFSYRSADGEEGYPGAVECSVTYSLTAANVLRLEYRAVSDASTIINLTNHAYFHLGGADATGDVLNHELELAADAYTSVDSEGIPTGAVTGVDGTPLDFRTARRLGERIQHDFLRERGGYDHNYVLNGTRASDGDPGFAARLIDPESGRKLEVYTTEPGLQLYTGNYLKGAGKSGREHRAYDGVCLECQHFPDSIHHENFPSTVLRPGAEYRQITEYHFGLV